jgi:hypothetical protein
VFKVQEDILNFGIDNALRLLQGIEVVKFKEEQLAGRNPLSALVLLAVAQPQRAGHLTLSVANKQELSGSVNGTPVPGSRRAGAIAVDLPTSQVHQEIWGTSSKNRLEHPELMLLHRHTAMSVELFDVNTLREVSGFSNESRGRLECGIEPELTAPLCPKQELKSIVSQHLQRVPTLQGEEAPAGLRQVIFFVARPGVQPRVELDSRCFVPFLPGQPKQ